MTGYVLGNGRNMGMRLAMAINSLGDSARMAVSNAQIFNNLMDNIGDELVKPAPAYVQHAEQGRTPRAKSSFKQNRRIQMKHGFKAKYSKSRR